MLIPPPALVSRETVLAEYRANLVVDIEQSGLSKFCADGLMWAVGMKGKEALGGKIFLTNFRVVFATHRFNRLVGQMAIPLDIAESLSDRSKFLMKKARVTTRDSAIDFVVWNVPKFIAAVAEAKAALDLAQWHEALRTESDVLKSGNLQVASRIEKLNKAFNLVGKANSALGGYANPLAFLKDKFVDDAIDKMIKNPVNRYFS